MKIWKRLKKEFTPMNVLVILAGLIIILFFRKNMLLLGGIYFILLGVSYLLEQKKLFKIAGVVSIIFGLFPVLIYMKVPLQNFFILIMYILLLSFLILFSSIFFMEKNENLWGKWLGVIISTILSIGMYRIFVKDFPHIISDLSSKGFVTFHEYIFSFFVSVVLIFMIATISKNLRLFFDGKKNNYLDISIGAIFFVLCVGFQVLKKLPVEQHLKYFLGIIASIFLVLSAISSLKNIVEK